MDENTILTFEQLQDINREKFETTLSDDTLTMRYLKPYMGFNQISLITENIKQFIKLTQPKKLILDLETVKNIDSSDIGMLISVKNVMNNNNGKFLLINTNDNIKKALKLLNFLHYFQ